MVRTPERRDGETVSVFGYLLKQNINLVSLSYNLMNI